jgi:hypothetical protein
MRTTAPSSTRRLCQLAAVGVAQALAQVPAQERHLRLGRQWLLCQANQRDAATMRLDGRNGDHPWYVWDCRRACEVKNVVWVDDATAQYAVYVMPFVVVCGEVLFEERQAERISIITTSRLILIDPVADDESDLIEVAVSRPTPLGVN